MWKTIGQGRCSWVLCPPPKSKTNEQHVEYENAEHVLKVCSFPSALKEIEVKHAMERRIHYKLGKPITISDYFLLPLTNLRDLQENPISNFQTFQSQADLVGMYCKHGGKTWSQLWTQFYKTSGMNDDSIYHLENDDFLELHDRVLLCVQQLLQSVQLLHSLHITHNDIWSENIMINYEVDGFKPKLIDWESASIHRKEDEKLGIKLINNLAHFPWYICVWNAGQMLDNKQQQMEFDWWRTIRVVRQTKACMFWPDIQDMCNQISTYSWKHIQSVFFQSLKKEK
jgi:serine/threonine protein kinase